MPGLESLSDARVDENINIDWIGVKIGRILDESRRITQPFIHERVVNAPYHAANFQSSFVLQQAVGSCKDHFSRNNRDESSEV